MKYSLLVLYALWILVFCVRGSDSLGNGWNFIFGIDKSYIRNTEIIYSKADLWIMHNGTICIIGITFFGILLFREFLKVMRNKRESTLTEKES